MCSERPQQVFSILVSNTSVTVRHLLDQGFCELSRVQWVHNIYSTTNRRQTDLIISIQYGVSELILLIVEQIECAVRTEII